jgi:polyisoprenoid-binding protein YceI
VKPALAGMLLAALSAAAAAEPARYVLDPEHTFAHFEVRHFGTSTMHGRFGPLQGEIVLDRAAGSADIGLRIPMASLSTGNKVFDARLREPDLFATEAWPEAFFVARQARFDGQRVAEVRGEFTLRGTSVPLTLKALRFACRPDGGREVCGGDFEGRLTRSDFGMTYLLPFIGDAVRLLVSVEGVRP